MIDHFAICYSVLLIVTAFLLLLLFTNTVWGPLFHRTERNKSKHYFTERNGTDGIGAIHGGGFIFIVRTRYLARYMEHGMLRYTYS